MPASFPLSVKVFTTKSDGAGNVIAAAHVNDLQDEVVALETGLLQGTAPLNSSNSTFATLSVTGNSTIGGALQVNGNSTITGSLTVAGAFTQAGPVTANSQPRCRVFHGSTQTLADVTETAVLFNSEDFDAQGLHSTGTNPSRLTMTSTGVWLFGASVNFAATSQSLYLRFRKNGVTGIGSKVQFGGNAANNHAIQLGIQAIDVITSTADYVEVLAWQNAGVGLQLGNASSRIDQNDLYAVKLW